MELQSINFQTLNDHEVDKEQFSQSFGKDNQIQKPQYKENEQQQMLKSVKEALHQANQILPAHKTISKQKQKVSFKLNSLTFYKQSFSQRLNRNSFPLISKNSKQLGQKSQQNQTLFKLKEQMGQFSIFMNDKKILVYQRIRNDKVNFLCKNDRLKSSFNKNHMKYFCSLFINPKLQKNKSSTQPIWQHVNQIYELESPKFNPDVLNFSSSFQSGNLFAAFKDTSESFPTYELYLQNDINTKGLTQWFHFKVTTKMRIKVKFKIMNFYKPTSLYQQGMKILAKIEGQQAKRVGTAIKYGKNPVQGVKDSYFLQFLYEFQSTAKPVYFSYFFPYNYTNNYLNFIEILESKYYKKKIIKKQSLCKTNMGNDLFMLTISNNVLGNIKSINKPIIYVIGRQHSGQTPSSFVVEGIINFLLSSRLQAIQLRQQFQFRIIPMVNIDGVISGNYRTNISGNDVNRQWLFPSKNLHPQIYYLKQQIISNKKNMIFFLDIHAHSRKMNSFFYGGNDLTKQNRLYPFVCSKLNKFINYADSSFSDDPSKQSTARVTVQKELNIVNSLTFQISFYGWIDPIKKTKHPFKPADLEDIGVSLALGFYYSLISIKKIEKQKLETQLFLKSNKITEKQKTILKNTIKIYDKWKIQLQKESKIENDSISEGSSIDPQHFALQKDQIANIEEQNQNLNSCTNGNKGTKNYQNKFLSTSFNPNLTKNSPFKSSKRYQRLMDTGRINNINKIVDYSLDIEQQLQQETINQSNLFSHSINQFFINSNRNFTVRQLEDELQGKGRYASLSEPQSILKKQRPMIDLKQTLRYHDKIKQIKNTFNYCLKKSQNDPINLQQTNKNFKKVIPSFDQDYQVQRNISLKSKHHKKSDSFTLKAKRTISFNQKRGRYLAKQKDYQTDFRLQKI